MKEERKTVILADDETDMLCVFGSVLSRLPINLETFSSGRALEKRVLDCEIANFHIAISDHDLGDVYGLDILLKIREKYSEPHLRLQSGGFHSTPAQNMADFRAKLKASKIDFFQKPIDIYELRDYISKGLGI